MAYIRRALESTVRRLSREFPAVFLTGARQTGKTTMLRRMIEEDEAPRGYVTLDDPHERELARADPIQFLQAHPPPVLIDEVQYAPGILSPIKMHIDRTHRPGDFWLTGSQVYRLMRGVQESLAGRVALLAMSPLSQREILGAPSHPFEVDRDALAAFSREVPSATAPELFARILAGSLPSLASGQYTDRRMVYSTYVNTYIDRDILEISAAIETSRFHRFLTAAAALAGQSLNYVTLAESADIDPNTAKAWLGLLDTLGIVFLLHPFSNSTLKRLVKTPKLYFHDTGLVCFLTKWNDAGTLMNGAMAGAVFENFVVAEILKSHWNEGYEPALNYYRDRDAREIDLVLQTGRTLHPIEIKKTAMPDVRLMNVFGALDRAGLPRGAGAVVCTAECFGAASPDRLIVPAWMI